MTEQRAIAVVIHPGMTALDLVGTLEALMPLNLRPCLSLIARFPARYAPPEILPRSTTSPLGSPAVRSILS